MISTEPDFKYACEKANEILICSNTIKTFPFSGSQLIMEMSDIELEPYSNYTKPDLPGEKIFGSKDAAIKELEGMFIIFYNDKMLKTRQRFTACHEFGHYYLNHDIDLLNEYRTTKNPFCKDLYVKYELETNMFAAQLLMPEQVLIELFKRGRKVTEEFLKTYFEASEEAAKRRIDTMRKVYNWTTFRHRNDLSLDDLVLQKFKPFIDNLAPRKMSYMDELNREESLQAKRDSWLAEEFYRR